MARAMLKANDDDRWGFLEGKLSACPMLIESDDERKGFLEGQAAARMEALMLEVSKLGVRLDTMQSSQESMGRDIATMRATIEPVNRLVWTVLSAAVMAVAASIWSVVTVVHK